VNSLYQHQHPHHKHQASPAWLKTLKVNANTNPLISKSGQPASGARNETAQVTAGEATGMPVVVVAVLLACFIFISLQHLRQK
jgi:hypothetical protein